MAVLIGILMASNHPATSGRPPAFAHERTLKSGLCLQLFDVKTARKFWPEEKTCADIFNGLSSQQKLLAAGVWCGMSDKEIAPNMGVNFRTLRFHMAAIRAKTGCRGRVEIALLVERANRTTLSEMTACAFFFLVANWRRKK